MQKNTNEKSKVGSVLDLVLLRRVLEFSTPYKKQFLLAAIAAILLSFLGPARPMLINFAVDNYIVINNKEGLLNITIFLIKKYKKMNYSKLLKNVKK